MNSRYSHSARRWLPDLTLAGLSGLTLCCALGCSTLSFKQDREGKAAFNPLAAPSTDGASINDVKGPLERNLLASQRTPNSVTTENSAGFRAYEAARKMYEQENYAGAEQAFKKVADDHALDESGFFRKRGFRNMFKARSELAANYYDHPLVEDSLFMLAESRYQQQKYPGASDAYQQLLTKYPNTRHLDACTKRLFDIAMTWMQFKTTTSSDVAVASFSDNGPASKPEVVRDKDYERPGFFNLADKQRPLTDTEGRALEALKAIWRNDPTGPLADDALMMTASHYLRIGRYSDAAETFQWLRDEFPDSPHVKDAFILGSYVTQASYQGADYDSKKLEESRQLKETALRMFPNLTPEERARLEGEISKLEDATVGKEFNMALFWLGKGQFDSVEMVCHHIINRYPDSKYAGKSRGLLKKLPEYRQQSTLYLLVQGITADDIESIDETQPYSTLPDRPELPYQQTPVPEEQPQSPQPPRYLPTLEMPKLKPIPVPRLWPEKPQEPDEAPPFENPQNQDNSNGRVNLTLGETSD